MSAPTTAAGWLSLIRTAQATVAEAGVVLERAEVASAEARKTATKARSGYDAAVRALRETIDQASAFGAPS